MVAIKSIGKIVSCLTKTEKATLAQNDKAVFDFFKKMTSGYTPKRGKDLPRICFEGSNYEELPSFVRNLVDGLNLKRPNVTVRGRSIKKGEGILGFQICDGNKVVGTTSYGLDLNRGEPIQQLRVSIGNGTEKAISFNSMLNTNLKGKSALKGDTFVNRKLAKSMGLSDEIIEGVPSFKNISVSEITEQSKSLKNLIANKGNRIHSIDECIPELTKIASKTGKVTQKSATEAVETILSKMGYNPKDVKLTFLEKKAQHGGAFCQSSGGLELNINMLRNHQDLADVIGHELTHMEDFILLYKYKGADNFRKIIGENFDKAWYDKMSKYVDANKRSSSKFSAIEKELKNGAKSEQANITGSYSRVKAIFEYINSGLEKNARHTELVFKGELKKSKIYRRTSLSEHYGQAPGNYSIDYSLMFKQIDKALNKYGANKGAKFNELYEQSLYMIDNELSALFKQLEEVPAGKARNKIQNKINEIIKNKHRDFEHLELKVMQWIQTKLGLQAIPRSLMFKQIDEALNKYGANKGAKFNELYEQSLYMIDNELPALFKQLEGLPAGNGKARNGIQNKINEIIKNKHRDFEHLELKVMQGIQTKLGLQAIPESQELMLIAMQRINPEIAEIQKALFEGRPKAEFKELVKKQKKLISQGYGSQEEFWSKCSEETEKIQREILEKDLKPEFDKTDRLVSEAVKLKEQLKNL